jgi:hypothetical protein
MERKHLAERRSAARRIGRRFNEGQGSEETDRRVEKRQDVGPSNIRSGVWGSSWVEESTGAKFDAIRGGSSESMPKKPPSTNRISERSIIGMSAEEVAVIVAVRSAIRRSRKRLWQIDLNKVPTRTKGAGGTVGNKKETIGGKRNGGREGVARSWGERNRRIVAR